MVRIHVNDVDHGPTVKGSSGAGVDSYLPNSTCTPLLRHNEGVTRTWRANAGGQSHMNEREKSAKRDRGGELGRDAVRRLPVMGSDSLPSAHEPSERADAARNRARILTAARHLLKERAMREICMDELAKEAGVGKGTLYRRFVDRTSLCIALLDESERGLQGALLRSFDLPPTASARERLCKLLHALLDFALENADLLVEAELSQRVPGVLHASPPYAWRRRELVRMLAKVEAEAAESDRPSARSGEATLQPETIADVLLESMRAELLGTQLARGLARATLVAQHEAFWTRIIGIGTRDASTHAAIPTSQTVPTLGGNSALSEGAGKA